VRAPHDLSPDFGAADWHERLPERFAEWLRDTPVFRSSEGAVYLTRHEDCAKAMGDDQFRRGPESGGDRDAFSAVGEQTPFAAMLGNWMLFMDPPRHDRVRAPFAAAFSAKALARIEPHIRKTAVELAAELPAAGETEIVENFAAALPVFAIADILGLPRADRALFADWAGQIMDIIDSGAPELIRHGAEVARTANEYFAAAAAERRRQPRDDLLTALVRANEAGTLNDGEVVGGCVFLLLAGHETTLSLISSGTALLARQPGLWRRLRGDRALLDSTLEEMLRCEAPVQKISRWASRDAVFGDYAVPAGSFLVAMPGAGNRDPAVFESPDEFRPERSPNRHLSFGRGRHSCIGAILARIEGRAAFNALLDRYGTIAPISQRWHEYTSVRSLRELRVEVGPA